MTTPDGGMEEALRWGLAETLGQIKPGADGLERIHARIGGRPPRPWLLAVGADTAAAARHWVWRGHWSPAWPAALPALPAPASLALPGVLRRPWLALPRLRRLPRPGELLRRSPARRPAHAAPRVEVGWLRPVGVLAVIVMIASVSFGVQPFRQAIIQASNTVLSGPSQPSGGAGTDGDGTQTSNGAGSPGASPTSAGGHGRAGGAGTASSRGASPSPTVSATCASAVTTAVTSTPPVSSAPTTPAVAVGKTDARQLKAELLLRSLTPSARPSASPSPTPSCATPSPSVTAAPATSGGAPTTSATPSAGDTSPAPSISPTPTPTSSPTPTPTPTDTGSDSPTDSPTDPGGESGDTGSGGNAVTSSSSPGS